MDAPAHPATDVLIVDDDRTIRETLGRALDQSGLTAIAVGSIAEARSRIGQVRAVLLDIRLRDGDGLAYLEELRASHPQLPVVMATAYGDSDRTITAMHRGAFEYLVKPFDLDKLVATLRRAIASPSPAAAVELTQSRSNLVGSSARMLDVWKAIGRASASDAPVLITGESGTGKELVAHAIHDHGARRAAPFVAVNIAALAAGLVESELFGHEKGAFTGAAERRIGRFERADGGTILLDEIGDLDLALQTKLLRVLQDGTYERVGATTPQHSTARVVAATSKPVAPNATGATLREDLFYRLGVLQIELPPLRERRSDIPLLVQTVLQRSSRPRAVSEAAMQRLQQYPWPGNVRELLHVLERAAVMSTAEVLDVDDLGLPAAVDAGPVSDDDLDLRRHVRETERAVIERAIARAQGNRAEAARLLGIARPQLYAKLRELGLK